MSNPKQCSRRTNRFSYILFEKNTLLETIEFLGSNFVAITDGRPITYNGANIQYGVEKQPGTPLLAQTMVIFDDPKVNQTKVAPLNSIIVEDDVFGYTVMEPKNFEQYYCIAEEIHDYEHGHAAVEETVDIVAGQTKTPTAPEPYAIPEPAGDADEQ